MLHSQGLSNKPYPIQGLGNAQLYNMQSPQTVCPQTRAHLEERALATLGGTTVVTQELGGRRGISRKTSVSLESSSLPIPRGSHHTKQRAPATPAAGTTETQ